MVKKRNNFCKRCKVTTLQESYHVVKACSCKHIFGRLALIMNHNFNDIAYKSTLKGVAVSSTIFINPRGFL
jgi:hypothetical protein